VVALVNGGTAREAELVAGALQTTAGRLFSAPRRWRELARERDPAGQRRRDPVDHRPFYHTLGPGDPGQGPRTRSRGDPAAAGEAGAGRRAARGRSAGRAQKSRPSRREARERCRDDAHPDRGSLGRNRGHGLGERRALTQAMDVAARAGGGRPPRRGVRATRGKFPRREFPCHMGKLREKIASGRENDVIRPDGSKTYQSAPTRLGRFGREI